jgi:two-component sensor histidine kinase
LKAFLQTILSFGISEEQSSYDKRRIKITNLINLLVIFFVLLGYTTYFILKNKLALLPMSIFVLMAACSLCLNKIQKINAAFLLSTLNVNIAIFFINEYYPHETGAHLFYFPLIVSVVLLNNPSFHDKHSLLHFTICLLFFIAGQVIEFPALKMSGLQPEQIRKLWYFDLVMSATLTAMLSFLLTRIIYMQNKEIIAQNEDLKKARDEVNSSLKEKEVLLAELHHRVKNNLAIISGLLNLQEDATSNREARQIIGDSKNRILSMALVHRMLYENSDLKNIQLGKYISELIHELLYSYNLLKQVRLEQELDTVFIPVNKSIPLGLILNEVVTNSIKYAFQAGTGEKGVIEICLKMNHNEVHLSVKDNGKGFPQDFNAVSDNQSLGIYLIKTLAAQIDGQVRFSSENGAKVELNFTLG